MDQPDHFHGFGEFHVGDHSVFGELKVDGRNANLRLHSHQYIKLQDIADRYVAGELSDRTKVSFIDCNVPPVPGSRFGKTERTYFADIFPHFVVLGTDHLNPMDRAVSAIYWHLPDLSAAFYDFDAFDSSLNPERFIGARRARAGGWPEHANRAESGDPVFHRPPRNLLMRRRSRKLLRPWRKC